jgi:hydroxymethylpyrimidine pyrophosphatase-like HAD family hydrolase
MKVLFTSDLDRTLIFSERTKLANSNYQCIEEYEGRNVSYISTTTMERLKKLHGILDFVPVTTRSYQQYKRLTLFQRNLQPKIAIAANGGVIIRNGEIDEVWQQQINQKMFELPLLYSQIQAKFSAVFNAAYVLRIYEVEQLFFVLIIDNEKLPPLEIQQLQMELEQFDWTCCLLGRKIYILPRFLTKGAAVQYIKSQNEYNWHVAAGDSELDLSMLELADKCFIPQHGDLVKTTDEHGFPIMEERSSNFSDACLQEIIESCTQK